MNTPEELDAAIQVAFRTQILAALQRPDLTPVEMVRLMKTYQKSLDQELKAKAQQLKERELALKERRLEQKEREEAAKEAAEDDVIKPISKAPSRVNDRAKPQSPRGFPSLNGAENGSNRGR